MAHGSWDKYRELRCREAALIDDHIIVLPNGNVSTIKTTIESSHSATKYWLIKLRLLNILAVFICIILSHYKTFIK